MVPVREFLIAGNRRGNMCSLLAKTEPEPSGAYIKEGRGSGSDLAVTKHDVRPPFIAPPPGLRFATPRSLSTPTQADYSHFKSLSAPTDNPTSSKEARRLLVLPLTPLRSSSSHSSRRGSLRRAAKSLPLAHWNRSALKSMSGGRILLLREGGARHVNAEPSPVRPPLQ